MGGKAGKKRSVSATTASAKKGRVEDKDQPWIDNYPPLRDFLREIGARCDWQVELPYYGGAYAEQWRAPGSVQFIVVVLGQQHGWEIYTPTVGNLVAKTLEDARARIFAKPPAPSSGPMDEGGE